MDKDRLDKAKSDAEDEIIEAMRTTLRIWMDRQPLDLQVPCALGMVHGMATAMGGPLTTILAGTYENIDAAEEASDIVNVLRETVCDELEKRLRDPEGDID